ncbi:AlpA family transcriptional regulator [Pseudacidovorax intermedius]|uniref:helix-turn-helix transcriptional regulator n=1 Tax=Pseudacidovorax intermedius TaxID=433924 RepID=UPI0026F1D733|nr:AlpA family phage regulatory protein [Pseudacidovorax intermedius]
MNAEAVTAARPTDCARSVQTLQVPDALLRVQVVVELTGLSKSSIRRRVAAGSFPVPVRDGPRCIRWVSADVQGWLRARREAR